MPMLGEIVHYYPASYDARPLKPYLHRRCIPAVVVREWNEGNKNLAVLLDGSNDIHLDNVAHPLPIRWETSVAKGDRRLAGYAPLYEWIDNQEGGYPGTGIKHTGERASWHELKDCRDKR
jgi:hypothetical protein